LSYQYKEAGIVKRGSQTNVIVPNHQISRTEQTTNTKISTISFKVDPLMPNTVKQTTGPKIIDSQDLLSRNVDSNIKANLL
jgi:hypothetical protein